MGPMQQLGAQHWFGNLQQDAYCFQLLKESKTVGKDLHGLLVDLHGRSDMQLFIAACLTHLCLVGGGAGP